MLINIIDDDIQYCRGDIQDFLISYINLPKGNDLDYITNSVPLSLYNYTRVAIVLKENLDYFKQVLTKTELTLDYCFILTANALIMEDDETDLGKKEALIRKHIRNAYKHNQTIDKLMKQINKD